MRVVRTRYGTVEIARPIEFIIAPIPGVPARERPAEPTDKLPYHPDRLARVRRGQTAYQQALRPK